MAAEPLITRGELIDAGHELGHAAAFVTVRPGTSFALIQSSSTLALVMPSALPCATERLAVVSAGPLFDMRVSRIIKSNALPPEQVFSLLLDYIDASDIGEAGSDAVKFRETMEELRDHDDRSDQIRDAVAIAMRTSLKAAQIYTHRRKPLAKIVFDLRALGPTEALVFAPDALSRMMINLPPETHVRDLAEWLVEQQAAGSPLLRAESPGVLGQEVTRIGRISSSLTRESKP